jgi:hypothetical protein
LVFEKITYDCITDKFYTVLLYKCDAEVALRRTPLFPEREELDASLESLLFLKRKYVAVVCPKTLPFYHTRKVLTGLDHFGEVQRCCKLMLQFVLKRLCCNPAFSYDILIVLHEPGCIVINQ